MKSLSTNFFSNIFGARIFFSFCFPCFPSFCFPLFLLPPPPNHFSNGPPLIDTTTFTGTDRHRHLAVNHITYHCLYTHAGVVVLPAPNIKSGLILTSFFTTLELKIELDIEWGEGWPRNYCFCQDMTGQGTYFLFMNAMSTMGEVCHIIQLSFEAHILNLELAP